VTLLIKNGWLSILNPLIQKLYSIESIPIAQKKVFKKKIIAPFPQAVKFLVEEGGYKPDVNPVDTFQNTPVDDCNREAEKAREMKPEGWAVKVKLAPMWA
jgi:hypothetical protein